MITLTPENTARAAARNFAASRKDKVRFVGGDLFLVHCPNPQHTEAHRVRIWENLSEQLKAECDCECRPTVVCHHISAALAVYQGIQGMRRAAMAPEAVQDEPEASPRVLVALPQIKAHTVYDVLGRPVIIHKVRGVQI